MDYRSDIACKINTVVSELEANGFFNYHNSVNRHAKLKNYAIGLDCIASEKEFNDSVKLWIQYIFHFILDDIKDSKLLRSVATKEKKYSWILTFLDVAEKISV